MTPPQKRGLVGALWDKLVGWHKGLPSERCTFSVQSLQIPLDDKIQLSADLYRPVDFEPLGTILVRSPYGISWPGSLFTARIYAARGYQVLLGSCRGTGNDEGIFEPGINEFADGHATVSWMRQQSWYTGSFATLGGSYLGYTQYALLSDPPEDMVAASIMTGVTSFGDFVWGTGALSYNIIAWADVVPKIKIGLVSVVMALRSLNKRLQPVFDAVPLLDAINRHFGSNMPEWLPPLLTSSNADDDCFRSMQQKVALENANIPILLTAGWNDLILSDVMNQYHTLQERGVNVALDIGPWTHLSCQSDPNTLQQTLKWLDTYLAEKIPNTRPSPVHIFVTGASEWRDLPSWPPATTASTLFLSTGSHLSKLPPSSQQSPSSFAFDPNSPTPSMSHPLLFDNGPGRNEPDTVLATRSDTLVFDTPFLDQDIEVYGQPLVHLQHSTSSPHADLLVLLSEVDAKGVSRSITEKYVRLDPERDQSLPVDLAMVDCAHHFRKGCRIRLLVAGGSHPRYIRNLGTGEDAVTGSKMQSVEHTVEVEAGVSKVVLPVTTA